MLNPEATEYIAKALQIAPILKFNEIERKFEICKFDTTWEERSCIGRLARIMRDNSPLGDIYTRLKLSDVKTGYWDKCLEHYIYERVNLELTHEQTCFVRIVQKTFFLGYIDPTRKLDKETKIQVLSSLADKKTDFIAQSIYKSFRKNASLINGLEKDADGALYFYSDIPIRSLRFKKRNREMIANLLKKILRDSTKNKAIDIYRNIRQNGWDNQLSRQSHPMILGFSTSNKRYFALTGRHRLAALKYLYSQGQISSSTFIDCIVIQYPWGSWLWGRPHPGIQECKFCERCIL